MEPDQTPKRLHCELCIVGAGYAGLNGLNAAAKYLAKGERVVFVDKNPTWGGQWVGQYDYVRLHQPYQRFTAGDQKWDLGKDPSYLATRREILEHLSSVPDVSAGHLRVDPRFGYAYTGHEVKRGKVVLRAEPAEAVDDGRPPLEVVADRMLMAKGTDIEILRPFELSSDSVRSIAVADPITMSAEFLDDDGPVYIIGAGKTAMDTVQHVMRHNRQRRPIHVISAQGMYFFVRDRFYPGGLARHREGILAGDGFMRMVRDFDGTNEAALMRQLAREGITTSVFGEPRNCRYGMMGLDEVARIRRGVTSEIPGYLEDVEGTTMTIRLGGRVREVEVPEGSWFLNCTSHLEDRGFEPVLHDSGLVCAPQMCMGFSGTSAYHVVHAWYRGHLSPVAGRMFRIEIDVQPRLRFAPQLGLMAMANTALVTEKLPLSVLVRFEGDFHKWYPLHRQIPTLVRLLAARGEVLAKAERLLPLRLSDRRSVSATAQ